MRLNGKTILVTAAGQGIGRASALALANEGARVIATDIRADLLDGLSGIETAVLDVTSPAAIADIAQRLGRLDGLFNCAGMVANGSLLDLTDEDWDRSLALNVTSMMRLTRALLPGMLERAAETGTASILNMASMASSVKGFVNRTAYGATKAAVIGLTKAVAAMRCAPARSTPLRCGAASLRPPIRCRPRRISSPASRWGGWRRSTTSHRWSSIFSRMRAVSFRARRCWSMAA